MPTSGPSASRVLLLAVVGIAVVMLGTVVAFGLGGRSADISPPPAPPTASVAGTGATPSAPPVDPSAPPITPLPSADGTESPTGQPTPAVHAAKETDAGSESPEELTGYVWPLRNARITSRFAPRDFGPFLLIDGRPYHDGLDLATSCGNDIRAAHDGVVLYAGRNFDVYLGYQGEAERIYARLEQQGRVNTLPIVIVIDDGNGYRSVYVHLSEANVEAGDVVSAGDVIGFEGATGLATGCHLHYGLIRMDGGWQQVLPRLERYGYPPLVRERIDPLEVLPWDDQYAPQRLQDRVNGTPSPSPASSQTPSPSPTPTASAAPVNTATPTP